MSLKKAYILNSHTANPPTLLQTAFWTKDEKWGIVKVNKEPIHRKRDCVRSQIKHTQLVALYVQIYGRIHVGIRP